MDKIREVIIVEGKYDKNTVSQAVDAVIIETSGFQVFSDREKLNLIRKLAASRGIIILTDSDSAGFLIRNHIKGAVPADQIKHAYIPDILGKERRKTAPSREGKLGVEGMKREVLINALRKAGATFESGEVSEERNTGQIKMADLFTAGLSGGEGSSQKRKNLLRSLELPERMSASALIDVLNALMTRSEFIEFMKEANIYVPDSNL
jgi:ribonuclease M5